MWRTVKHASALERPTMLQHEMCRGRGQAAPTISLSLFNESPFDFFHPALNMSLPSSGPSTGVGFHDDLESYARVFPSRVQHTDYTGDDKLRLISVSPTNSEGNGSRSAVWNTLKDVESACTNIQSWSPPTAAQLYF